MLKKTKLRTVILLIAILSAAISLVSCRALQKTVTDYLAESDLIPEFDTKRFSTVEFCFGKYYYTDLESPEILSQKTIDVYYEFCAEDNEGASEEDITLDLIDSYIYAIGDDYAFYRMPDEAEDYTADMSGSFVGIGVSVVSNYLDNTVKVTGVEIGSPAEGAGIQADDYIVAVDGVRVQDIGVQDALDKIKGDVGSSVEITILRGEQEISLTMVRQTINQTTVSYSFLDGGKIGYIKITSFKSNTAEQFKVAIDAIEAAGVDSVIFDLRNNPGGYLTAVTDMLSYLVPTGTDIASFSNSKQPIKATEGTSNEPTDHVLKIPSVVLCNSSSASAAELFSGAMRDYNDMGILKSTLVGETTYKKGIMQTTLEFYDSSTLTLTVALYNPPSKINFHGVGVEPDIFVENDADYLNQAIEVLKNSN